MQGHSPAMRILTVTLPIAESSVRSTSVEIEVLELDDTGVGTHKLVVDLTA